MQKLLLVLSPLVLLLTAACASSKPAAPAKEYHLTGEVMRIDAQVRSATIKSHY